MFKNIKVQITLLMVIVFTYGCVSDEGNYDYNEINEFNVTGIEKEYTVYTGDYFKIAPNLNPTLDDGSDPNRYEYSWVAVNPAKLPIDSRTIISTTKDLDGILKLPPAKYTVYYFIKDKVTGVNWQQPTFTLNVVSSIYEGWLVLGDVNGKARLDMISYIPNAPSRVITDVLDASGSALKLSGKAVDVDCVMQAVGTTYGIYVTASESGTARIDPDSFSWVQSQNLAYETVGGAFETNFGVDFMKSASAGENLIYSKGDIFSYYRVYQVKYGLPQNKVNTETKNFYAAPFIAENGGGLGSPIFYDKDNRRFLRYNVSTSVCSAMPPVTGSATVLDWSNTNSDLVYMTTSSFNSAENFAVLRNISTGKYHLLRFSRALAQNYFKEIINAPDFDKATKFAVSPDAGYLFYVVGGKLYEYDNGTQSAKLMLDKGSEEITYIEFHARSKSYAKNLVVGSYDGKVGKLELFSVPPVNGDLILLNTYTGLSKIVDVAFRAR